MAILPSNESNEALRAHNPLATSETREASPPQLLKTCFGFSLRLPGVDYITKLLKQDGGFEFPETDLVSHLVRPGDVCIDAGCQVGYYSCLLAKCVGPSGYVYAFDANPAACETTRQNASLNGFHNVEVVHAALGDGLGNTPFYISTDNQSGLSSLGALQAPKEVISVPWLRLDDFIHRRKISRIRLLKIDVEGAEELVLHGLGDHLARHRIDFVLLECFDERLSLLNTSTERVADLLIKAGYLAWEYGMQSPDTWSKTERVTSRGDCNYLFCSPSCADSIPAISMAGAIARARRRPAESTSTQEIAKPDTSMESASTTQEEASKPGFSPAQALWNQREKLASMRPHIEELYKTVASPGEMSLYQWAQLTAAVLEFQPDLIIELGRKAGNSTTCFLEAANELGGENCRVVSICLDPTWQFTSERLKNVVPKGWFDAGNIVQGNILTFDFAAALSQSKRCLVFWDAHGFDVAECVLGGLLPLLPPREHVVLMHDLSDLRYCSADSSYETSGIWKGENEGQAALWLGWIFSRVSQSISILDFTTRNNISLQSADESIHEELAADTQKAAIVQSLLGPELGSLQAHWFWFTLNEAPNGLTFPAFSPQASLERFERKAAFEATTRSVGWKLLQRWRKLTNSLAPAGSRRRRAYNYCLRRLGKIIS